MTPIFGKEIALQISFLTIPLVLLAVALLLLRKIVDALGFARPGVVFAVAVFAGYALLPNSSRAASTTTICRSFAFSRSSG